ncbi:sulfite exporter TauE/SafE family protein [Cetobacterium somerae]|uniref:sulfite exporter TauE/SafE family protein n=1 Tax=Cetobacterium sp. NK01 TaxID=2993530 RepID=UPI00211721DC|nr:sulfite exporter TauE/SafE family protein [Cetobacterium sp. NK01]MCQ8211983.1 sulfite exporter TauE/SafE family protein [Cetobacterium sp. NK01]
MDTFEILLMLTAGIGMGFSLMGMSTAIVFSPILISIYGSKLGNGIMFIPFLIADLYVSYLYRKNYDKKIVLKLIPFSVVGMIIASIFATYISEYIFRKIIAIIIILASILFFLKKYEDKLTKLSWVFGIFGGASSYLANVSGPIFNIYLLSYKQNKEDFIGTRAIFFTVINIIKLFMYIFIFKNINSFTISRGVVAIPTIFLGVFLAKKLLKIINQKTFNTIIVFLGLIVAIKMLL